MTLPFLSCPALGGCGDPGDPIEFACAFDGTERLYRMPDTAAPSRTTGFIDLWVRRTQLGSDQSILIVWSGVNNTRWFALGFMSTDELQISEFNGVNTFFFRKLTVNRYRDPGAWLNLRVLFDTSNATASQRVRLFVNGEETAYSTGNDGYYNYSIDPSYNYEIFVGDAVQHNVAAFGASNHLRARLSRFAYGIGALPDAWGYVNADGHWVTRAAALPVGTTHGAILDFANPLDLGQDTSGNGNNWTPVNLTPTNQVTDTPTTPRRTLNALRFWGAYNGSLGLSRGGWQHSSTNSVAEKGAVSAQPHSRGKWYYEVKVDGTFAGNFSGVGTIHPNNDTKPGERADTVLWLDTGTLRKGGTGTAYGTALASSSDVLMVALDADLGHIWFGRNGVWFGGGNPATGTNPSASGLVRPMLLATYVYSNLVNQLWVNAGQAAYAHAPPDGFLAPYEEPWECPDILNPDDWFTIRRVSGGAGVSDLPWDPTRHKTLVLSKRDDASSNWRAVDTIGGAGQAWATNDATYGLLAEADGLTAFTADGYMVGAATAWQGNRIDYLWRAGRRAGFDILTVAHVNGVASTVPHAAGGSIDYAWVVRTDTGQDRRIHHRSLPAGGYLRLNSTAAYATDTGWFSSTANEITLGAGMPTGTYRLYVWRSVPQFSAFGLITGNGSADGVMDPMDFAPRLYSTKSTNGANSAPDYMCDTTREPSNPCASELSMGSASPVGPGGGTLWDMVSNGVKQRNSDRTPNQTGVSSITAAWAAAPAKFARAR